MELKLSLNRSVFAAIFLAAIIYSSPLSATPKEASEQIVSRFQQYLRINTAQPNPNYKPAADFILSQAESIGVPAQILEFVKDKPVVLLTWQGKQKSLPSILLNSHIDVVPADIDTWVHHPFSAYKDSKGDIYARGSQDMKCVGVQYLEALRNLKKRGFVPLRTIHVSFVPDEEIGGRDGAGMFVNSEEFQRLNVGVLLDEGLASPDESYRIFYGERFPWWLEQPYGCGIIEGFDMNLQLSEAEVGFDINVSTGTNAESLDRGIAEEWVPVSHNFTFEFNQMEPIQKNMRSPLVTVADNSNRWWTLLEVAILKAGGKLHTPEIYPAVAATDARYVRELGIPAFGFSPMANTPILLHEHNEFLNEAEYLKGVRVYEAIIESYASYMEAYEGQASLSNL